MHDETGYRIDVEVEPQYIPEQSEPGANKYAFTYTVTIRNIGSVAARLLTRHWIITDANGLIREVRGAGVVGEQPYLRPGEGFRYTSGSMIETPIGSMRGSYQMLADDGVSFEAEIPQFVLAAPRIIH
jgi:ApaG protein